MRGPVRQLISFCASCLLVCACHGQTSLAGADLVEIQVPSAHLTLFPTEDQPTRLTIRARSLTRTPVSLRCRAVIDTPRGAADSGYRVSDTQTLELNEPGLWGETALTFSRLPVCVPMTTGKLVIRGTAGGAQIRQDVPLRLGRGALAFLERRRISTPSGDHMGDVACFENPFLRAEVLPIAGCISSLFAHHGGPDALVPGDHPLGLVWAGLDEWYHSHMPTPGESVTAVYTARAMGSRVSMSVNLEQDSDWLEISYDARSLTGPPGPIHLVVTSADGSRISLPGAGGESTVAPTTQGESLPVPAGGAGRVRIAPAGEGQALVVEYSVPTLEAITANAQPPWYDYLTFNLREGSPGLVSFRLRIEPL